MGRRLAGFVHLADENGVLCSFGPDDDVPAWAAEQITNPSAWADSGDVVPLAAGEVPPRSGKGSGRDAWAVYAAHHGVEVSDDDGRGEIIAALDAVGVPTE